VVVDEVEVLVDDEVDVEVEVDVVEEEVVDDEVELEVEVLSSSLKQQEHLLLLFQAQVRSVNRVETTFGHSHQQKLGDQLIAQYDATQVLKTHLFRPHL